MSKQHAPWAPPRACRWWYRYRGDFYAMGPTTNTYSTVEAAARAIGIEPDDPDGPAVEVWPDGPGDGAAFGNWSDE